MFKEKVYLFAIFIFAFAPIACALMHDPTKPLDGSFSTYSTAGSIKPDFILFSKGRKIIWINNRYLTVGDKLMNGIIVDITPTFLVLKTEKGEIKLSFARAIIKTEQ